MLGIVVPITSNQRQPGQPAMPAMPPSTFLAMATSQTHALGKLLQPDQQMAETTKTPWQDLSNGEQNQLMKDAKPLPNDVDKYDEFLNEHGTILLPDKKTMGPNEWQDKLFSPDIQRYDLPDGKVILKKQPKAAMTS